MKALEFGIIGPGHFGKHYVRLLSDWGDVHLKVTAHTSDEARQLIADPDLDAVVIATPSATHEGFILECLKAGKHVLVEKPMVTSVAGAVAVQAQLQVTPLVLMVGFQYVYNDYVRYLGQLIQDKRLGKILYVLSEHLYPGPLRSDVGCFMDAGVHELSVLKYLFDPGKVIEVVGKILSFGTAAQDDFTAATIRFEHGLIAHLVDSRFAPQKTRRITIVGAGAMAVFDDMASEHKLQIFDVPYPAAEKFPSTGSLFLENKPPEIPTVMTTEPLRNELEHFIHCVRTGEQPLTDVVFGSWVAEQCETILKDISKG